MGGIDKKYLFTACSKQREIESTKKRVTPSNSKILASEYVSDLAVNQVSSEESQCEEDNPNFEYQKKRKPRSHKRKPDFVEVLLPRKILKATAVTAKRYGFQSSAHTATLANVINSAGGNLKDFDIFLKSAKVHSNDAISDNGLKIKENFIKIVRGKLFCVHFDTKLVKEYFYGENRNVERLALVISSPSIDKEQLIGVLSITDSHGITQAKAIKEILESWNLWDLIHSVCLDTTSSNTG